MANDKVKNKNSIMITVVVAIVVGLLGFYGGMQYQKSQRGSAASFAGGQPGQYGAMRQGGAGGQNGFRAGGRGGFGGASMGEIISVDANSVTLKLQDGSSKIVNVSDKTTISKTDTASKSDLKAGDKIAAFGTPNSDGSIDAQNIQLNPMFRMGGQGARPSPGQ